MRIGCLRSEGQFGGLGSSVRAAFSMVFFEETEAQNLRYLVDATRNGKPHLDDGDEHAGGDGDPDPRFFGVLGPV